MKKIIIIVAIVLIYVLVALGMEYYVGNDIYFLAGKNVRFHYKDGEWTNENDKGTYSKFQIYNISTTKKVGKYNVMYKNGWYAKISGKYVSIDGTIMYKGKGSLNILSYDEIGKLDDNKVKTILKKFDLPVNNYNGYYINVDLDNDGTDEQLYCLKNYYNGMYFPNDVYYSLVFVIDGNETKKLILDRSTTQMEWSNEITYIIDFNNDGNYEILISRSSIDYSNGNINMKMYGLSNGEYVKLVSAE